MHTFSNKNKMPLERFFFSLHAKTVYKWHLASQCQSRCLTFSSVCLLTRLFFLSTQPTHRGGWKSDSLLFAVMHHWQEERPCWQYFAVTFASTASLPSLWSMKTDFDLICFISDHILPWDTRVQPIIVIVAIGAEFVPFLTIQYVIHEPELNPALLS